MISRRRAQPLVRQHEQKPDAGSSVVLTIDENIQYVAEKRTRRRHQPDPRQRRYRHRAGPFRTAKSSRWPVGLPLIQFRSEAPADARMNRAVASFTNRARCSRSSRFRRPSIRGLSRPTSQSIARWGRSTLPAHHPRPHQFGLLTVSQILAIQATSGQSRSACAWGRQNSTTTFAPTGSATFGYRSARGDSRISPPARQLDARFGRRRLHGPGSRCYPGSDGHRGIGRSPMAASSIGRMSCRP